MVVQHDGVKFLSGTVTKLVVRGLLSSH